MPRKPAPDRKAPVEEHKKHAEEFLRRAEHKKKPVGFKEANDVVPPDEDQP